jgi:hypothetical protein
LFLAWAFELTPEGVKRTEAVSPAESVTPHTGRTIDKLILAGMVVVVAVIVADRFLLKDEQPGGLGSGHRAGLRSPAEDAATMAAPVVDVQP